jgi:hypothetical protein
MIARNPATEPSVWTQLAAPIAPDVIEWRQDGKTVARDGRFIARFVSYITANIVRDRLDAVVPGEFDSTLELLPPLTSTGSDGEANDNPVAFKCRLQILGVIREDVGTGKDYKSAATDAFKRAAVRYGIGHELYDMEPLWVQMDGEGKFAKPVEDPATAYARRYGSTSGANGAGVKLATAGTGDTRPAPRPEATTETPASQQGASASSPDPLCPKCDGPCWDNRIGKRNPRAPDWKCKDRSCDGVIWPPKGEKVEGSTKESTVATDEEIPF